MAAPTPLITTARTRVVEGLKTKIDAAGSYWWDMAGKVFGRVPDQQEWKEYPRSLWVDFEAIEYEERYTAGTTRKVTFTASIYGYISNSQTARTDAEKLELDVWRALEEIGTQNGIAMAVPLSTTFQDERGENDRDAWFQMNIAVVVREVL